MTRRKTISRRLLLAAIFVGLNALCYLGVIHGRHVARHTRVDYSHIPAHTGRGGSRAGRSGLAITLEAPSHAVIDHAPKVRLVKVVAGPSAGAIAIAASPVLLRPEDHVEPLLARENVLALGSAPRAPGLGRAPPVA
jgi:hypothetical protein